MHWCEVICGETSHGGYRETLTGLGTCGYLPCPYSCDAFSLSSSSRIFVKILFQELAEFMGIPKLNERLRDPYVTMATSPHHDSCTYSCVCILPLLPPLVLLPASIPPLLLPFSHPSHSRLLSLSFEGLLPRDNPKNTRFAINFFTSIGLGGLTYVCYCSAKRARSSYAACFLLIPHHTHTLHSHTHTHTHSHTHTHHSDDLREHLKNAQKLIMAQRQEVSSSDTESDSSKLWQTPPRTNRVIH